MSKHLGPAFWILLVGMLHAWWLIHVGHLHGDLLYFESIFQDGFLPPHARASFQYTEAIFAFPDLILFYLVRSVVSSPAWAVATYQFVLTLGQASLLYTLWRRLWPNRSAWAFAAVAATFYFLTDLTHLYSGLATAPEHHGALGLLGLAVLWQLLDLNARGEANLGRWLGFNFIVMLGFGFSDLLVVPAILAPLLGVLAVFVFDQRLTARAFFQSVIVNVVGLISGVWIKYVFVRNEWINIDPSDMVTLGARRFVISAQRFISSLTHLAQTDVWFFLVLALIFLVGRNSWKKRSTEHNLALIFFAFVFTSKLTAILVNGRWDGVFAVRYLQELYLFPLLEALLFVLPPLLNQARARVLATSLVGVGLGTLLLPPRRLGLTEKPELTRCLEQHRADLDTPWGLGDFWVAKLVTFTSTQSLVINQVKRNYSPYFWMNSPVWYTNDIYGRQIEKYSFAIAFTPDGEFGARERFGAPTKRFMCPFEDREVAVLTYPRGIVPAPADESRIR